MVGQKVDCPELIELRRSECAFSVDVLAERG
jgi:hypothetical protein